MDSLWRQFIAPDDSPLTAEGRSGNYPVAQQAFLVPDMGEHGPDATSCAAGAPRRSNQFHD